MQTPDAFSVEGRSNPPVSLDTTRRYKASIRGGRRKVAQSGAGTRSMGFLVAEKDPGCSWWFRPPSLVFYHFSLVLLFSFVLSSFSCFSSLYYFSSSSKPLLLRTVPLLMTPLTLTFLTYTFPFFLVFYCLSCSTTCLDAIWDRSSILTALCTECIRICEKWHTND
ncbi:hypothetical protein B0O80DRAFT_58705 [Mortierella sp. GBAus27b]|nr:hypothetical protein B0O80DRAFT_58705 [Mortierella sp. GBAus27b]